MRTTFVLVVLACSLLAGAQVPGPRTATRQRALTPPPTPPSEQILDPVSTPTPTPSSPTSDPPTASESNRQTLPALAAAAEKEIVFKGKYFLARGSCLPIGGGRATPLCHGFEVNEVVSGNLDVNAVKVRHWTLGGEGFVHPEKMKEGTVYTLRFSPSEVTRRTLRENQNADNLIGQLLERDPATMQALREGRTAEYTTVWVNGKELAVIETDE